MTPEQRLKCKALGNQIIALNRTTRAAISEQKMGFEGKRKSSVLDIDGRRALIEEHIQTLKSIMWARKIAITRLTDEYRSVARG